MKRHAPAAERNRDPIAHVLRQVLPASGLVLEVASGTGQHAAWFAGAFPDLMWRPSDPNPDSLASIAAWREEAALPNLLAPVRLDAQAWPWPVERADAILCVNMVHISPWAATLGLLRGAAALLRPSAPLILYGPYRRADALTAPSNEVFDLSLKSRDPSWGLRNLDDVSGAAEAQGLRFERLFEMPANNLTLVYRRI
jgi:SAM-dependent methyltransferase